MSRQTIDFNLNWQFQLFNTSLVEIDPIDIVPSNTSWRDVTLPHDWSVEHAFDKNCDGATGYLPGGIGWYKKEFANPVKKNKLRAYIIFDGIYNNSELYLNGKLIKHHPYGYSPLCLDITDQLKDQNELLVKVDRRRFVDSRWYTGSGIYRDVKLVLVDPIHINIWGNTLKTPVITDECATVQQRLQFAQSDEIVGVPLVATTTIVEKKTGQLVAAEQLEFTFKDMGNNGVELDLKIINPKRWSIENPHLYQVHTAITQDDQLLDEDIQQLGVRTIEFNADTGFSLNGISTKIKGVCLHHDGGLVGAAVPDAVWRRRLLKLKKGGVNAIRCAHNPASTNFLTLCDEIGLLVQEEFFDEWDNPKDKRLNMGEQHDDFFSRGYCEHFQQHAESDLKNTLNSRVNHPSIFMWSIGNEIEWTYPRNVQATGFFDASWDGNYFWNLPPHSIEEIRHSLATLPKGKYDVGETAQKLSAWVKQIDKSRPVTANCILPSASYESGYADALDVIGFSYRRVVYDYGHEHHPELPIIGNENLAQWHDWKAVIERPHVAGLFLWTGINYMGESHNQWPTRTTNSGLLDAAGFEKPSYLMFQSLWLSEPVLNVVTQKASLTDLVIDEVSHTAKESDPDAWQQKLWLWPDRNPHWNYEENEIIIVEVYTNCEHVELQLNGKSFGFRLLSEQDDHIMRWAIPFVAGNLEAVAYIDTDKSKTLTQGIKTATQPTQVAVTCESQPQDGQYIHAILQNLDNNNDPVRHQEVTYQVQCVNGEIVGVDNGAKDGLQPYQGNTITTHHGQALVLIKKSNNDCQLMIEYENHDEVSQSIVVI
jgi:hypothetical protein